MKFVAVLVLFSVFLATQCDELAGERHELQALLQKHDLPMPSFDETAPEEDKAAVDDALDKRAVVKKPIAKGKKKIIRDKLSYRSCRWLLQNKYCQAYKLIRKVLCPALCRCRNMLSYYSCIKLKHYGYCSYKKGQKKPDGAKELVRKYCRYTCYTCIRVYYG